LNQHEIKQMARANGEFVDTPRYVHVVQGGGFDYTLLLVARWFRRRVLRRSSDETAGG
jgi:hypothetical protein